MLLTLMDNWHCLVLNVSFSSSLRKKKVRYEAKSISPSPFEGHLHKSFLSSAIERTSNTPHVETHEPLWSTSKMDFGMEMMWVFNPSAYTRTHEALKIEILSSYGSLTSFLSNTIGMHSHGQLQ